MSKIGPEERTGKLRDLLQSLNLGSSLNDPHIKTEEVRKGVFYTTITVTNAADFSRIGIDNISNVERDGKIIPRTVEIFSFSAKHYLGELRGGDDLYAPRGNNFEKLIAENGELKEGSIYLYLPGGYYNSDHRADPSLSMTASVGNNQPRGKSSESAAIPDGYAAYYLLMSLGYKSTYSSGPPFYYQGSKFDASLLNTRKFQYVRAEDEPGKHLHGNNKNPRGFSIIPEGKLKDFHDDDEVMLVVLRSDEIRGERNSGYDFAEAAELAEALAKTNPTPSVALASDGGKNAQAGIAEVKDGNLTYPLHIGQTGDELRPHPTFLIFRPTTENDIDYGYEVTNAANETLVDTHNDAFTAQQQPAQFNELQQVRLLASKLHSSGQPKLIPGMPSKREPGEGIEPTPRPHPVQEPFAKILLAIEKELTTYTDWQRPIREYMLTNISVFAGAVRDAEIEAEKLISIVDLYINPTGKKDLPAHLRETSPPQLLVSDEAAVEILINLLAVSWHAPAMNQLSQVVQDALNRMDTTRVEVSQRSEVLKSKLEEKKTDSRSDKFSASQTSATEGQLEATRSLINELQKVAALPYKRRQTAFEKILSKIYRAISEYKINERPAREYLLLKLVASAALLNDTHCALKLIETVGLYVNAHHNSDKIEPDKRVALERRVMAKEIVSDIAAAKMMNDLLKINWRPPVMETLVYVVKNVLERMDIERADIKRLHEELTENMQVRIDTYQHLKGLIPDPKKRDLLKIMTPDEDYRTKTEINGTLEYVASDNWHAYIRPTTQKAIPTFLEISSETSKINFQALELKETYKAKRSKNEAGRPWIFTKVDFKKRKLTTANPDTATPESTQNKKAKKGRNFNG